MVQVKKVILLAGPTSSGKSKLAIELAKYCDGEVINADSMQIYKEFSILTSKPNREDIKIAKHHLYGFNSVKKKFSTGYWLKMVLSKIEEQWKKGKQPIVVGGTGLYFKALTDGLVKIPNISNKVRTKVRKLHAKIGQKNFYNKLTKLDKKAKNFIKSSDSQRSMRAYEVKKFTGKSLFDFIKDTKLNYDAKNFRKLFINTPRDILNRRIDERVEKMFKDGAVEEVKKFLKMKVSKQLSSNKIIGVDEIKNYLLGKITLIKAKETIKQRTRQYAKRQFTWARGNMKSWEMIYSSDLDDLFRKAINKIL